MRELHGHRVNGCNDELKIEVVDDPGCGGANHRYDITGFDTDKNPSAIGGDGYKSSFGRTIILFQNGTIPQCGTNGITHEVLLAILIDRLDKFQSGPFACEENQVALEALRVAQGSLKSRTEKRLARGVEGTHKF